MKASAISARADKTCVRCNVTKPVWSFNRSKTSRDGLLYHCSDCGKKAAKDRYRKPENKDRAVKLSNEWRSVNRDRYNESLLASNLRKKYGISVDDYYSKLSAQGGKCATPKCNNTNESKTLHVDHDHLTGDVRGLLCFRCNAVLGQVNDDKEILQNLIDYLNMHDGCPHGGFVASIYASNQLN